MRNLYVLKPKITGNYLCNDGLHIICRAVINGQRDEWREITETQANEIEQQWV